MRIKRRIKILVDVAAGGSFLYLLSYHPGQGVFFHGILGLCFVLLIIVHQLFNLRWYKGIFKGAYTIRRSLNTLINAGLLMSLFVMILSAYFISGLAFDFAFLPVEMKYHMIHSFSAAWLFVFICLHLGWHLQGVLNRLTMKFGTRYWFFGVWFGKAVIFVAGMTLLVLSPLKDQLCFLQVPKSTLATWEFLLMYVPIGAALCLIPHFFLTLEQIVKKKGRRSLPGQMS